MLVALVLEAPVSTVASSTGATSTSAPSINIVHKILNLKEFTLFCREFENVVNLAFLVLIFWGGKLVGANFYAFCNYDDDHDYNIYTCPRMFSPIFPWNLCTFTAYTVAYKPYVNILQVYGIPKKTKM